MLMWNENIQVHIQNYSWYHIECFVLCDQGSWWWFTGFYGNPERCERHHSWTLLYRLKLLFDLPLDRHR